MTAFAGAEAKRRAREDKDWERSHQNKINNAKNIQEAEAERLEL